MSLGTVARTFSRVGEGGVDLLVMEILASWNAAIGEPQCAARAAGAKLKSMGPTVQTA
jgi:hypothetical protein